LNTPQPVIAEHALRFKISDHRGRCRLLGSRALSSPPDLNGNQGAWKM
jgi:hypothetical protein